MLVAADAPPLRGRGSPWGLLSSSDQPRSLPWLLGSSASAGVEITLELVMHVVLCRAVASLGGGGGSDEAIEPLRARPPASSGGTDAYGPRAAPSTGGGGATKPATLFGSWGS